MYAIRYRTGQTWYWRDGFHSIQEAESFRIRGTSACEWTFYKRGDDEKYKPILYSGSD